MKKRYLNSKFGKKAIVFLLDALVSVFLVLIILASLKTIDTEQDYSNLALLKQGSDITRFLIADGTLSSLDKDIIENKMLGVLPNNIDMKIIISCNDNTVITAGREPKKDKVSTTLFFKAEDKTCTAKHYTWLR